jgi:hypothetical protein
MTSQLWDDDEQLLAALGEALTSAGPITERMLASGEGAFAWRTVDDELAMASLMYDSSVDDSVLVRKPSADAPRMLVFEGTALSVEIQVTGRTIVGQLIPPDRGEIAVQTTDGIVEVVPADDMGCFLLTCPPPGPMRLRCRSADVDLVTEWLRL